MRIRIRCEVGRDTTRIDRDTAIRPHRRWASWRGAKPTPGGRRPGTPPRPTGRPGPGGSRGRRHWSPVPSPRTRPAPPSASVSASGTSSGGGEADPPAIGLELLHPVADLAQQPFELGTCGSGLDHHGDLGRRLAGPFPAPSSSRCEPPWASGRRATGHRWRRAGSRPGRRGRPPGAGPIGGGGVAPPTRSRVGIPTGGDRLRGDMEGGRQHQPGSADTGGEPERPDGLDPRSGGSRPPPRSPSSSSTSPVLGATVGMASRRPCSRAKMHSTGRDRARATSTGNRCPTVTATGAATVSRRPRSRWRATTASTTSPSPAPMLMAVKSCWREKAATTRPGRKRLSTPVPAGVNRNDRWAPVLGLRPAPGSAGGAHRPGSGTARSSNHRAHQGLVGVDGLPFGRQPVGQGWHGQGLHIVGHDPAATIEQGQ